MAVLSAEERRRTWAQFMRAINGLGALNVSKTDLRAAVDATDQWIEDNQAAYNSAIPQPARGSLSQAQKTLLFCYVAMRRAGILRAVEDG